MARNKLEISPSLLDAPRSWLQLRAILSHLVKRGIKYVHVDVMDGKFVPRNTLGFQNPALVKKLKKSFPQLHVEVHLMVQNPAYFFRAFTSAGADLVYFHIETCSSAPQALKLAGKLKELSVDSGVAINPRTNVSKIANIAAAFDSILVMSVQPGRGGQKFRMAALAKIRKLHLMKCQVNVDGGVKIENIALIRKAGAKRAVVGTAIFHGNPVENVINLQQLEPSKEYMQNMIRRCEEHIKKYGYRSMTNKELDELLQLKRQL